MQKKQDIKKILLIDDDELLTYFIEDSLTQHAFTLISVHTAEAGLKLIEQEYFDLVLLDLSLPDEDGLVLLRKVCTSYQVPFVVISQRSDDDTRIAALELGARDFIAKPFRPRELLLRIQLITQQQQEENNKIALGTFELNASQHVLITSDKQEIKLTLSESKILAALAKAQGNIVDRNRLMDVIKNRKDDVNMNSLTVIIHRLRTKIAASGSLILTVKGIGYRLLIES